MKLISLICCLSLLSATCWSADVYEDTVLKKLFQSGDYVKIKALVATLKKSDALVDPDDRYSSLLGIVRTSISYDPKIKEDDYRIFLDVAECIIQGGADSLLYQGILLDYVGQDCSVFNDMPAEKFSEYRKQTSSMFVRVYDCAREASKSPHDMSIPLGRTPPVPPELMQEMFDKGAKYSKVDGSPIVSSLPKDLAEKYAKISADFVQMKTERKRHQAAERVLDTSNDVAIKNYFISRYSREPVDFKECKDELAKLQVKEKLKSDIICSIAKSMQMIPPKDICVECGIKTGDGGF